MSFSPTKHILHTQKSDLSYHSKIVTAFTGIIQKRLNMSLATDLDCDFSTLSEHQILY